VVVMDVWCWYSFWMIIPYTALSPEVLRGVIEEFVLREGTEYGDGEVSLDTKVLQVMRQLERGDIFVLFDAENESCDIVTRGSARYRAAEVGVSDDSQPRREEEYEA
jgi:uncharacterized protein YheU (UPF0270 family)